MALLIKRIYEPAADADGYRILVDRLWPRGVSKPDARLDAWLKEVAPSTQLRQWFNHDRGKFSDFAERYRHELSGNEAVEELALLVQEHPTVSLLYGARDTEENHAVVLRDFIAAR